MRDRGSIALTHHQQIGIRVFENQEFHTAYVFNRAEDFYAILLQKRDRCLHVVRREEKQGLRRIGDFFFVGIEYQGCLACHWYIVNRAFVGRGLKRQAEQIAVPGDRAGHIRNGNKHRADFIEDWAVNFVHSFVKHVSRSRQTHADTIASDYRRRLEAIRLAKKAR